MTQRLVQTLQNPSIARDRIDRVVTRDARNREIRQVRDKVRNSVARTRIWKPLNKVILHFPLSV